MSNAGVIGPLSGRHALVTGAGKGIGAAIATALAREGARVTLLGRQLDRLTATASTLGEAAFVVAADVADPVAVDTAFTQARARFGEIDLLVNNAGQAVSASFSKTDAQVLERMLAVNLTGVFHCTHQVLPAMLTRNFGRIVNIASTAGLVGYAYCAAYCAAKHGVIGMTGRSR